MIRSCHLFALCPLDEIYTGKVRTRGFSSNFVWEGEAPAEPLAAHGSPVGFTLPLAYRVISNNVYYIKIQLKCSDNIPEGF
jgi:hypothetical protein